MQQLTTNHGVSKTINALSFLLVRLKTHKEAKKLVEQLQAERKKLRSLRDAHEDVYEERIAASSEISYLDGQLDDSILQLNRETLAMAKGKRSSALYQTLFPKAASELIRPVGGKEQARFVQELTQSIEQKTEYEALRPQATEIQNQQAQLADAEKRREDLYVEESKARRELDLTTEEAQRLYNLSYHRLSLEFPEQPALVESFFRSLRTTKKTRAPQAQEDDDTNPEKD